MFFLAFYSAILIHMADTWGMMPKSQEDSETIEQAIARMIDDHNDDDTAHSATGQAIDVHRNSEIIDHLALSVVKDKLEKPLDGGMSYHEDGRGAGAWSIYATDPYTYVTPELYNIAFSVDDLNAGTRADAYINFWGFYHDFSTDTFTLEFVADFGACNELDGWVSWGYGKNTTYQHSAGFYYKASNGNLYAYNQENLTATETLVETGAADAMHRYRVEHVEGAILFYIDEVLVATHTTNIPTGSHESMITMGLKNTPSGYGLLTVRTIDYWQSANMTY